MSQTPSKFQPIIYEDFYGTAESGTNARVSDKMPMAHITDIRDRACLMKNIPENDDLPGLHTHRLHLWLESGISDNYRCANGTRLHIVTYSMCHCVSVCAYFGNLCRQPYSVSRTPSKTRRYFSLEINDGYAYYGTYARAIAASTVPFLCG